MTPTRARPQAPPHRPPSPRPRTLSPARVCCSHLRVSARRGGPDRGAGDQVGQRAHPQGRQGGGQHQRRHRRSHPGRPRQPQHRRRAAGGRRRAGSHERLCARGAARPVARRGFGAAQDARQDRPDRAARLQRARLAHRRKHAHPSESQPPSVLGPLRGSLPPSLPLSYSPPLPLPRGGGTPGPAGAPAHGPPRPRPGGPRRPRRRLRRPTRARRWSLTQALADSPAPPPRAPLSTLLFLGSRRRGPLALALSLLLAACPPLLLSVPVLTWPVQDVRLFIRGLCTSQYYCWHLTPSLSQLLPVVFRTQYCAIYGFPPATLCCHSTYNIGHGNIVSMPIPY